VTNIKYSFIQNAKITKSIIFTGTKIWNVLSTDVRKSSFHKFWKVYKQMHGTSVLPILGPYINLTHWWFTLFALSCACIYFLSFLWPFIMLCFDVLLLD